MISKILTAFEKKMKIRFKNKNLLRQAFIHRSYLNEHPDLQLSHNERLEFLGDAVLELVVTEYLYGHFDKPEGELTNWRSALVKGPMLAKIASNLGINNLLCLSRGESKSQGKARQLILANAFEALIGAVYLDRGYTVARNFLKKHLIIYLDEIIKDQSYKDHKSRLQELAQEQMGITPIYKVSEESGPDHAKHFTMGVYISDRLLATGSGASKQEAEQSAAEHALGKWQ